MADAVKTFNLQEAIAATDAVIFKIVEPLTNLRAALKGAEELGTALATEVVTRARIAEVTAERDRLIAARDLVAGLLAVEDAALAEVRAQTAAAKRDVESTRGALAEATEELKSVREELTTKRELIDAFRSKL